jgi:hypothetical protein
VHDAGQAARAGAALAGHYPILEPGATSMSGRSRITPLASS